jgi:hypothetical protein
MDGLRQPSGAANPFSAAVRATLCTVDLARPLSNRCARCAIRARCRLAAVLVLNLTLALGLSTSARAQAPSAGASPNRLETIGVFLAGGAVALGAHEGGHLFFDLLFDADPGIDRVEFHGLPFFAITHRGDLTPRRELTVSSAGFWVQHAGSEWLLTRRPRLRHERAPFAKGVLAFNILTSAAYAGAAFGRTGPLERDTRGIAAAAGIQEPWVGAIVLAPAVFDTWRYFRPDAKWPVWASRAAKAGMVLLVVVKRS